MPKSPSPHVTDYVVLQGKQVPYEIAWVPVERLILDPENPRIEYLIGHRFAGRKPSQQDLCEALWEKDAVKALCQAILANGGVREHIIVQRTATGAFLVREGNCRTACCMKLKQSDPQNDRFDRIPAQIFDQELTEEDIAVLIAVVHVAKKISWDAYTQAKQISELHRLHGKPYEWLTTQLRMSRSKVSELLNAYDAMNQFLSKHSDPKYIKRFTLFHELVRKKALKSLYDHDIDGFRARWYRWVLESKIHDPRHVRALEQVLNDPDAVKAFDKKGYEAAAKVLQEKDPSLASDVFNAIKKATEAIKNAPIGDVQDLRNGDQQKLLMLRRLRRAVDDFAALGNVQL